jgi:hypothetical protein
MTDYPKTEQEIFDRVWQHFVVEENPLSYDETGSCKYRGCGGAKCAVGIFIPDDLYDPALDKFTGSLMSALRDGLFDAPSRRALKVWLFEYFDILSELQKVHDTASDISIDVGLRDLAWKYELQVPA